MYTTTINYFKSSISELSWKIIEDQGIINITDQKIILTGKFEKVLNYVYNITKDSIVLNTWNKKFDPDEIVAAELYFSISIKTGDYYDCCPEVTFDVYLSNRKSGKEGEELLETFKYSKDALECFELPIELEYRIKSNPFLDWSKEIVSVLDKII